MEILKALHIEKQYEKHKALSDVSIEVFEGSIFGLLGPNGAGKTSLIRIINQITAPDKGEVLLFNKKISPEDTKHIGYLPEERGLYKKMKVGEQAIYLARLKGLSRNDAKRNLKTLFEKFEIFGWWDKKVEELSKGMQQKIQFIITIVHQPKLLIFDEPFSGFDPVNADLLKREILALKQQGASIIFSTHNMESVEELCDRIALINKSEKVLDGDVRTIKAQHRTNLYEIHFAQSFNKQAAAHTADYEIQDLSEDKQKGSVLTVKIRNEHFTSNDLLQKMISCGQVIAFKELLPSMHQIFVRTVTAPSPQN